MAKAKNPKPFNIKGRSIVTFLGEAEWAKVLKKQLEVSQYSPKGQYSVNLLADPDAEDYKEFVGKIDGMLETAHTEIMNDEGTMKLAPSKKSKITKNYPYKEHIKKEKDDDGNYTIENETGKMMVKCALKDVQDKPEGRNYVKIRGAGNVELNHDTMSEIGNGSKIKCKVYANPYYMPATGVLGVSLKLEEIKIYELVEYGSGGDGEDFDDDDGYEASSVESEVDNEDF